ncbi:hypothetical protein HMPREF1246_1965 [Acidaminococcus sp. BV3L6]|uniref:Uncharacterized protein n=1 Tax=Acidaminococcus intestini (strain RyC-MR95) TaxID=568816 RepID=G4Q2N4_ACIIR|nr:hypothetical protein Acin_1470 [Acidaminococcus intestini RyC-MR95]ERL20078.1 hypothetical protein HMPREF1246_1965 [Acidaminococcus sp. BV3L6]
MTHTKTHIRESKSKAGLSSKSFRHEGKRLSGCFPHGGSSSLMGMRSFPYFYIISKETFLMKSHSDTSSLSN